MSQNVILRALAGLALTAAIAAGGLWVARVLERPRSVVLVTIDTLRADRLSSYGYRKSFTPNFDRLAREGARFALAYCDIPWTTGSLASTMTGTYGPRHGVFTQTTKLPLDRTTLAEILRDNGYRTGAIVASFATDSSYNLDQGFDSYDDDLDTAVFRKPAAPGKPEDPAAQDDLDAVDVTRKITNDGYRTDKSVTDAAIAWLKAHRDERFFLWVHYFGPHERFVLNKGVNHRDRVVADYDPDTRATDAAFGRLLDTIEILGLADDTLLVLHSDHGQELREHGTFGHGHNLYEQSMRIPILMQLAGRIRHGTVVPQLVRNIDLMPTILDYLDIDAPEGLDGRSIRPLAEGGTLPDVPAYMELVNATPLAVEMLPLGMFFASSTWHGMRMGPWKYMNVRLNPPCLRNPERYGPFGFLDVNPMHPIGGTKIPDEDCGKPLRQNLFEGAGDAYVAEDVTMNKGGRHRDVLDDLFSRTQAIAATKRESEHFELDPEQERKLRSLGYLR